MALKALLIINKILINYINGGEKIVNNNYQCILLQKKKLNKIKIGKLEKHLNQICLYSNLFFIIF